MIRIVILETDRMVRKMLYDILQNMKGFQIEGAVNNIDELSEYKIDLLIGEIQENVDELREWIMRQRCEGKSIDVLPITGVAQYAVYRCYVDIGAIDYILKPFESSRVKQALLRYHKWKMHLIPDSELQQMHLDAFYYPGIVQEEQGISQHTYERIEKYIQRSKEGWFTAKEAAMEMKISPVTMRRYLERMHQRGYLQIQSQYGKKGRPVYEYCVRKRRKKNMDTMVVATQNKGKLREFKEIFPDLTIMSMAEAGVNPDIVENGTTFEENALIKAKTVYEALGNNVKGRIVIADDSGIEIDYLDKAPGVYSARYLGEDTPYSYKNQVIMDKLSEAKPEERTARYVAAIAVVLEDGTENVLRDTVEGTVAYQAAGEGGFGYDPIFYVPAYGKTMAELTPDEKNAISHRGKALRAMKEWLDAGER